MAGVEGELDAKLRIDSVPGSDIFLTVHRWGMAMLPRFDARVRATAWLLGVAYAGSAPVVAQQPAPSIAVTGAVSQPLTLTPTDLAAMPRAAATTTSNGISTAYEGVWLADVLKKAGVPFGGGMRGTALAGYVVASASDGYQVVFSLGELDPDMTDTQYLLADKANGKPLSGQNGAFRLVIPKDKHGARSIRMLTSLNVVQLRK
jgi:DMSO/TMAO reductase YedYZ molybdopterin-dependent catalytic subunit